MTMHRREGLYLLIATTRYYPSLFTFTININIHLSFCSHLSIQEINYPTRQVSNHVRLGIPLPPASSSRPIVIGMPLRRTWLMGACPMLHYQKHCKSTCMCCLIFDITYNIHMTPPFIGICTLIIVLVLALILSCRPLINQILLSCKFQPENAKLDSKSPTEG